MIRVLRRGTGARGATARGLPARLHHTTAVLHAAPAPRAAACGVIEEPGAGHWLPWHAGTDLHALQIPSREEISRGPGERPEWPSQTPPILGPAPGHARIAGDEHRVRRTFGVFARQN